MGQLARQRGIVVIASDFRGERDWRRPAAVLGARHQVLAIEIGDPREQELPAAGRLALVDPETGALLEVDTTRPALRRRFSEAARAERAEVAAMLRAARAQHVVLSTRGPWLRALGKALG